jgi:hypothetical protein
MSNVSFNVRQNLVVSDSIADGILAIQAEHRDGTISNTFEYVLPEAIDSIGTEALIRGFKDVLKTSFNGIADSTTAIGKANKAIELLSAGKMPSRSTNGSGTPKELPYLVQAVLRLQLVADAAAWYSLSKNARAALATKEVYQLANDIEVVAKAEAAKARLEAVV